MNNEKRIPLDFDFDWNCFTAHQCTLDCVTVPCPGAPGNSISAAQHAFSVTCHPNFVILNVRPCRSNRVPHCSYIVDYEKPNQNTVHCDERAKKIFKDITHKSPLNVGIYKKFISYNPPSYSVEYKVNCSCQRPNFEYRAASTSAVEFMGEQRRRLWFLLLWARLWIDKNHAQSRDSKALQYLRCIWDTYDSKLIWDGNAGPIF